MFIDPHVHCRDGKQAYKETIAHALSVADRAGFTAIFDMPNTDPPITRREHVLERLALAKKTNSPVWYGTYMALTADNKQIEEAVTAYNDIGEVVGFKLYAGHSVGNIGVTNESEQRSIYSRLRQLRYRGVVVVHCEKDNLLRPGLWNPERPASHAAARPPEAEIASVKDQIDYALDADFQGHLHIAHISVPEAVEYVANAHAMSRTTCGVCPHHIIYDALRMEQSDGLLYKMNPPLRPQGARVRLLEQLRDGMIDWIETDHAPHTLEEKLNKPHMSGIPGLPFYPTFIAWLRTQGFSGQRIRDITYDNIARVFEFDIPPRVAQSPSDETCRQLAQEYPFDPYKDVSF